MNDIDEFLNPRFDDLNNTMKTFYEWLIDVKKLSESDAESIEYYYSESSFFDEYSNSEYYNYNKGLR